MHETSIAFSILESARRLVGSGKIESITVAVGELSSIEPDLLAFAWEAIAAGEGEPQARLEIEWKQAKQYCPVCRKVKPREGRMWQFECPDCGHAMRVEGGYELDILRITYTGAEEAESRDPGNTGTREDPGSQ